MTFTDKEAWAIVDALRHVTSWYDLVLVDSDEDAVKVAERLVTGLDDTGFELARGWRPIAEVLTQESSTEYLLWVPLNGQAEIGFLTSYGWADRNGNSLDATHFCPLLEPPKEQP